VGRSEALSHLRICDFTGQLAGAGATRALAAFGAQVIRVEDPVREGRWDILRGTQPYVDERRGVEVGGAFNNHNVEKLGVTINLRTEEGRDLLRRLVAVSDVVAENFAAGVLARMGFPYEELTRLRPDILYVSNCGFGHTGPYRRYKTWGPIVQAVCGLTFSSGLPDEPPAGWGFSYMDHHGGNFMAIAILAGLIHRQRTGEGQWIDMACTEAGATLNGPVLLDWSVNGRPLRRPGMPHSNHSQHPPMAPHDIYPATGYDQWVAIACRDDDEWTRLAAVIGEPWTADARFVDLAGRLVHETELDERMAEWTRGREREVTVKALLDQGIPAAIIAWPEDRIDHDPNTAAWGLWPSVEHREMGTVRVDGIPVHLGATDWVLEHGAPCLGQHNEEVFGGILGLGTNEIAALRAAGAI
jgi:benzylsuccinate CoA-transferase BbsF subunit